jgi:hypothetical protein
VNSNKKRASEFLPVVAQLKTAVTAQSIKRPIAPPVYRPQPTPKVLQRKQSPSAPQSVQAQRHPIAPAVYRPEQKKIAQLKPASTGMRVAPKAPPVYRPQSQANMPRSVTVQMKSVQTKKAATIFSASRDNLQPQRSSSVIQRVIVIGGRAYGTADKKDFLVKCPEKEHEDILTAMSDLDPPGSIDAALADKRRFFLTREEDPKFGVIYGAEAEALVKEGKEVTSREAGNRPIAITRPARNPEEIVISGLIMCVGVIIEARRDGRIEAASAAHFVTPDCVEDGRINAAGRRVLEELITLVKERGTLNAILAHTAEMNVGASRDSFEAVRLITSFLLENGVTRVNILRGPSTRTYRLGSDGKNNAGIS